MGQKGFATLEVILMVVVIGILTSIAVPRFTDITAKANTAKVQADLSTLESASQFCHMEKGTYGSITELESEGYIDAAPIVPEGSIYLGSATATKISNAKYGINEENGRAYFTNDSKNYYIKNIGKNGKELSSTE